MGHTVDDIFWPNKSSFYPKWVGPVGLKSPGAHPRIWRWPAVSTGRNGGTVSQRSVGPVQWSACRGGSSWWRHPSVSTVERTFRLWGPQLLRTNFSGQRSCWSAPIPVHESRTWAVSCQGGHPDPLWYPTMWKDQTIPNLSPCQSAGHIAIRTRNRWAAHSTMKSNKKILIVDFQNYWYLI